MEIIRITATNRPLVTDFLKIAGATTLQKFRYYDSRSLDIMDHHLATFVIRHQDNSIAYGHLDSEDDTVWLGIAIAENFQGKGLGTLMMTHLLSYARLQEIPKIKLAVDLDNEAAIPLYKKFGFKICQQTPKIFFMEWTLPAFRGS